MTKFRITKHSAAFWRVTLDNPPLNLFDPEVSDELQAIIDTLEHDQKVKVVVFDSAVPDYFMAHIDLARVGELSLKPGPTGLSPWPDVALRLQRAPFLTVGVLRGRARGVGSEFLLALDVRFASRERGVLAQIEVGCGLIPGGGGLERLPALIGRARSLEAIVGADDFDADTAAGYGWINRSIPDAELDDFVDRFTMRVASFEREAIAAAKQTINDRLGLPKPDDFVASQETFFRVAALPASQARIGELLGRGLQQEGDFEFNLAENLGPVGITARTALTAPNLTVEVDGRTIAYRTFGAGPNMILCIRLRGTMDMWDPLFLDKLAENFTVTVFDYSGLGYSTGKASYGKKDMAKDVYDLVNALGFEKVIIGGWSLGGFSALVFAAHYPEKVSHVLAIGTMPPGIMVKNFEEIFFPTAMKPSYGAEDEYVLFFEPNSARSRKLADASIARIAARSEVKDFPTAAEVFNISVMESSDPTTPFPDPDGFYSEFYKNTDIPVLALSGDHDIIFPVENWYAVNDLWPTLFVATWPECGHGPHHQYPELSADLITSFISNTPA